MGGPVREKPQEDLVGQEPAPARQPGALPNHRDQADPAGPVQGGPGMWSTRQRGVHALDETEPEDDPFCP
jgi:hypothetical protein